MMKAPRAGPVAVIVLVTALAVLAPAAVLFWPDHSWPLAASVADSDAAAILDDMRAAQQKTASEIKAINDRLAAGRADLKMLLDQLSTLTARVDTLQKAQIQILHDYAERGEHLTATPAQIGEDKLTAAEELRSPTQMPGAHANADEPKARQEQSNPDIATASNEGLGAKIPFPMARPTARLKRKLVAPPGPPAPKPQPLVATQQSLAVH